MLRRRAAVRTTLAAAIAAAAPVMPASAESLADAIAIAYAHNPTIVGQRFTQKATDEIYVQARAQYGPTLNLQSQGYYQNIRQPQLTAAGVDRQTNTGNTGEVIASVSQPLWTAGRLRGQLLAARAQVESGRETLRAVEQQLVQNVILVYAQVIRDEQRVEVGRQNVAVLEEQLRENRARYGAVGGGRGAGDVTLTDVGLSDSRLQNARITLAQLQSQLAVSRGQYLQIVGQNPGTLEPIAQLPDVPASVDEAFEKAERSNPGLLASKYAEQSSSATAASVRGELGPTVALTGQARYSNRLFPFSGQLGTREVIAGVTVSQPLFAAGALRSRVREADARNGAAQAAVDAQRRQVIQSVNEAWSSLSAVRLALASGERQVTSAQLAYAGMHREQLEGLRSTLDTLNAEQELVSAQLNLLQNRFQEQVAGAALLAAVGALNPVDLVAGLDRYDATANFRRVRNRGRTPLEPVAQLIDRIGSANPRRPMVAELAGEDGPVPDAVVALPPRPSADQLRRPLVPITESRLVPASELPGGLPPAPDLPPAAIDSAKLNDPAPTAGIPPRSGLGPSRDK